MTRKVKTALVKADSEELRVLRFFEQLERFAEHVWWQQRQYGHRDGVNGVDQANPLLGFGCADLSEGKHGCELPAVDVIPAILQPWFCGAAPRF
jgi:hypothetical protein